MLKPRVVKHCRNHLHPVLTDLRKEIESEAAFTISQGVLGIKVWILPPWYYRLYLNQRSFILVIADLLAPMPVPQLRLIKIGELRGGESENSGVPWVIGKGLLAHAMFSEAAAPWAGFIHDDEWPQEIEQYPRRRFKALGPDKLRGHAQRDISALRAIYGTAVAAPLVNPGQFPPFGCITAHTPRGVTLTENEIDICGVYLSTTAPAVVDVILSQTTLFA